MTRVLIIDDDVALLRALRVALQHSGYEVITAVNGEQGIGEAASKTPDVIVLDLGLPDIDGLAVCSRIRSWSSVPIIVLSAADAEQRKVAALDGGANDYVTKPFGMAELEARIRAAIRHHQPSPLEQDLNDIQVGSLTMDLVHRQAILGGSIMKLTSREFDLLAFLAKYAGKTCTHQMILESVWGAPYAHETQYLHAYIHRLREKLRTAAGIRIDTAPGIGYFLAVED